MAFNSNDFTNSTIYKSYSKFNDAFLQDLPSTGNPSNSENPYSIINEAATTNYGFYWFTQHNLGNISYYLNFLPYFFIRFSCLDGVSDIKNIDSNFEQIKLPLKYFTSGDLFGLNIILDSIKNGKNLDDPKNWSFFNSFTDDGTVSKTDDFKLNAQSVFYNTLYQYFKNGYYQLELKTKDPVNYTVKGKIETNQQTKKDEYKKGSGEAPNYLDIFVDSKQKVKNKVLLRAKAVRTSYSTKLQAPQQIIFKRNNEELLASFALEEEDKFYFAPAKEYSIFTPTSLSNISLDSLINDLIKPAILYFNVAHYVLRCSVLNYEFFIKNSKENDIFNNNNKQSITVKNFYSNKNAGLRELIKTFPVYIKELIVNLLNLIDPTQVGVLCDKMIDYFEENNSNLTGLYSRSDLKDMLIKLNDMCFETYKRSDPKIIHQNKTDANIGRVTVGANLIKINTLNQVEHSNDLILQKVYVYRDTEKPSTYEDILQQSKLYKIIDLPKNPQNITLNESLAFEDNIDVNKKYYYCFLSQREYDIYDEIYNLKEEKIKGTIPKDKKEIVQHFSSPTKVLELEMISTDNSTYLDYNFFTPEQKEIVKNKINFLNKIRVSPSDIQKNSFDVNKGEFVKVPNLVDFWYNTTQLISSNDYSSGRTLKLRISSPKTKRKIDFNVRHFVLDYYNLGDINKKTTYYDINDFSNGKKYYEVYSALKPQIKFDFKYANKDKESKSNLDLKKSDVYKIPAVKDPQLQASNLFVYDNVEGISLSLNYNDPNVPKLKDYFKSWQLNIYDENKIPLNLPYLPYIDTKQEENKNHFFQSFSTPAKYQKFIFEQKVNDKYGFNVSSSWEFQVDSKVVGYELISQGTNQINEGDTKLFTLKITNYPSNKEKTIKWKLLGEGNSIPSNDFKFTEGLFKVSEKISDYTIMLTADQNIDKTDTTNKTYKLVIYKNKDYSTASDDIFLTSDTFKVLDTSKAPLSIGQIIGKTSINEGELVEYSIQIKNRFKDEKFKWYLSFSTLGKATLNDFETPLMQEQFLVFDNNDTAKIQIKAKEDASFVEGDESFILSVNQVGKGEVRSATITIKDTSVKVFKDSPAKFILGSFEAPFSPKQFKDNKTALSNEFNNVYYIDSEDYVIKKVTFSTSGNQRIISSTTSIADSGILGSKTNPLPSYSSTIIGGFNTQNANYLKLYNNLVNNLGFKNVYYIEDTSSILNKSKNAAEFRKLFRSNFDINGVYASTFDVNDVTYIRKEQYTKQTRNISGAIINTVVTESVSYPSVFPSSVEKMCNDGKCSVTETTPLRPIDGKNLSLTGDDIASPWHGIVTGSTNVGLSNVWGNNTSGYSSDSDWSIAAVHAGLISQGEIALLTFESVGNNLDFISSTNNNIITKDYLQKTQSKQLYNGYKIKLVKKFYKPNLNPGSTVTQNTQLPSATNLPKLP